MGSLFIKDSKTAFLAERVAKRLGTTKTEAVRRGLEAIEQSGEGGKPQGSTAEWLRTYRAAHPLPDKKRMKADKAFFDELSGEEDIFDPWAK